MIDRNPNVDNSFCRGAAIFIVQNEWELHFRERIGKLIESIKPNLKANSAKILEESYDGLRILVQWMIRDKDYLVKENATVFQSSIMGLEDAMRRLLDAYIGEKNLYHIVRENPKEIWDGIDGLMSVVYSSLDDERNPKTSIDNIDVHYTKKLMYGYPAISQIIKFLRNLQVVHGGITPAYRSRLVFFDNIYTLSSIVVLSLYGYTEMLEVWQDTINVTKRV